jgi:ABC-type nitrate/sulfonate/bicarbonate transport system permease component
MDGRSWTQRIQRFRSRRAGWIRGGCYVVSIGALLGLWQYVGNDFGILFAPLSVTLQNMVTLTLNGTIGPAMLVSGRIYVLTLGIDIVTGIGVGLALARIRWFAAAFEPYVFILYSAPTVALVPMAFAVFGFALTTQVLIAVLISVFPIVFGVMEGARSIPPIYLDVGATYGSSESQLWRDVILPYVTPYLMTGVRQTIAMALVGTLVSEFFLSADGVSGLLIEGVTEFQPAKVLAVTVLVSALALVLVGVGDLVERVLVPWPRATHG